MKIGLLGEKIFLNFSLERKREREEKKGQLCGLALVLLT